MTALRGRGSAARRRREARLKSAAIGGGVLLVLLVLFWSAVWPYVTAAVLLGCIGAMGWWLWRTDRIARARDRRWRQDEEVKAGRRTLAEVDGMTGTEFEELVASLCRRDGCTEVRRVGGSHDNGADVLGRLPDGRAMVIQCKRYAPSSTIASRELRDLLGAKVHFRADVAVFVTTTRFSRPSEKFAVEHGILAVHRDHLGLWNSGASLLSLSGVNGHGQGDLRHRARWKQAYGK
ncbi:MULTISPECIES: restriction endonuclease [Streptomyces]|uniref:Restriction endonuclease n=1 Tax=Streptomyces mirabilis TaxID=68239 RepID=A0ABU3V0S5_9ACTN|nr:MULTISPECIES: restriction endonuclease [Streptomyces]MCX4616347.1 restriction endonuclease [Streptomyces mirabilis]MCX5346891.1 restriction endonuclease [Streptomyces mirabilis]MDU8999769.1 restriction endonuclease [Streptomyces mirabilis]